MAEVTMTAATVNITTTKGDTQPYTITVKENGVAVDFTNWTAKLQLRYPLNNEIAVTLTSSPASGITLGGSGVATISTTTINALPIGEYKYDFQVTKASGIIRTLLKGVHTVIYE